MLCNPIFFHALLPVLLCPINSSFGWIDQLVFPSVLELDLDAKILLRQLIQTFFDLLATFDFSCAILITVYVYSVRKPSLSARELAIILERGKKDLGGLLVSTLAPRS